MCILAKMKGWQIWDTAGGRVGITMHCECSPCGVPSPPHPLITMTMMLVLLIYIHAWVITWAGVTWGVTNSQPKTQEIRVIKRVFPLFLLFLRTLLVPNSDWWPLYVPTQPSLFIHHHLSEHPIYQEEVELHSFDKRIPWFWIQLYNHTKYNQNQLKPTNARKKTFFFCEVFPLTHIGNIDHDGEWVGSPEYSNPDLGWVRVMLLIVLEI